MYLKYKIKIFASNNKIYRFALSLNVYCLSQPYNIKFNKTPQYDHSHNISLYLNITLN